MTSGRQTTAILAAIALITVLAWAYLLHLEQQMSAAAADETMMAAMGMAMNAPWSIADVLFTFVMWSVMMAAMMAPSATPVLLLSANAPAGRGATGRHSMPFYFGTGYFLVWMAFSAAAALVQWGLHDAAWLSPAMAASSPRAAGAILIGAGVYQFTPLKGACLSHCRSPLDFLMAHWRTGAWGAVRMGAHHGAYCLGCCWALMAVLFGVGVMNLLWVAAISALVLAEKIAPASRFVSRAAGTAMIVLGIIKVGSGQ